MTLSSDMSSFARLSRDAPRLVAAKWIEFDWWELQTSIVIQEFVEIADLRSVSCSMSLPPQQFHLSPPLSERPIGRDYRNHYES